MRIPLVAILPVSSVASCVTGSKEVLVGGTNGYKQGVGTAAKLGGEPSGVSFSPTGDAMVFVVGGTGRVGMVNMSTKMTTCIAGCAVPSGNKPPMDTNQNPNGDIVSWTSMQPGYAVQSFTPLPNDKVDIARFLATAVAYSPVVSADGSTVVAVGQGLRRTLSLLTIPQNISVGGLSISGFPFTCNREGTEDMAGWTIQADGVNNCFCTNCFVTTIAGDPTTSGSTDGNGATARFNYVYDVSFHPLGTHIAVADRITPGNAGTGHGHRVRLATLAGEVTTLAGCGQPCSGHLDGAGDQAKFTDIMGVSFSPNGLVVAVADKHYVRLVTVATKMVTTLAGGGNVWTPWDQLCLPILAANPSSCNSKTGKV